MASESSRMQVAKGGTLALAGIVLLLALNPPGLIAEITAVAFALAGNTIFPLFLLGIWWERANDDGAVAGMLVRASSAPSPVRCSARSRPRRPPSSRSPRRPCAGRPW